ncbi:MAG: DUF1552 domain-containing protein [Myxococcales bacterium]|nr:MAG: DUF1552 domain-containing protein [Myxococcales bacterium]
MLRGAGSIAIALPWLEIMGHEKLAHAAGAPAKRFLSVYTPGGTVLEKFWPTDKADPTSSNILKPLAEHKNKLLVVKGLNMDCAVGEQHQAGIIGLLTGSKQNGSPKNYSTYPSIDQVIASRFQKDPATKRPRGSLQFGVRWATGKSHGLLSPINAATFEDSASVTPLPPRLDPQEIFTDLFGSLDPSSQNGAALHIARRKSVLDYVDKRYVALASKLGAADKAKLDNHLTKLREIESALEDGAVGSGICKAPTHVDTKGYNPTTGLSADDGGNVLDQKSDEMIPKVGTFMMDMMVMAFACNLTSVGHFQWTDTEAKHTFPWLSLKNHHHFYQHDGGFQPVPCEQIGIWYSQMHAHLLSAMDAVEVAPGVTMLDESVVFFGSELAHPPTHAKKDMPFMLAGGGGGLKGGRLIDAGGKPHNNLLVSILNLFGDTRTSYGHAEFNSGAQQGLTG